ncbi:MAG: GIY-YIG nuclease family protein [Pseudomonadota bacterium]
MFVLTKRPLGRLVGSRKKRWRSRPLIPWFRNRRAPRGTVYLLSSRQQPRLFKVGFTKRLVKERRAELNRVAGDNMAVVYTVSLPWARACETLILRRLRRHPFRHGDRRGTEWFWLTRYENIQSIIDKLEAAALATRRIARWRLSWPKGGEIKRFFATSRGSAQYRDTAKPPPS